MFLYFKNASILSSTLLLTLFLTISCMHVKNLDLPETGSSREISLNLNRLSNSGGTMSDSFESVIESDNYYIAVGMSNSDLSSLTGGNATAGGLDFMIAKFNKSDLSLVSVNNLGGTNSERFYFVIESDGYYIAVGYSGSDLSSLTGGTASAGNYDFVIAKFNKSDLSLVSLNNLGGAQYEEFYSVIESDNYYIAVGMSNSDLSSLTDGTASAGNYDFVIAKFNKSDLSLVNLNNLGGTDYDCFSSVIESYGYYIAVGYSGSDLSSLVGGSITVGFDDFVIAKFNKSDLSLVSLNNLGGSSNDYFYSVIDSDGHYIVVGYSSSDLSGFTSGSVNSGGSDFVIAKFNKSDLSLVSLNNLGGSSNDYFYSVVESGSYYIAVGESHSDLSALSGGVDTQGNYDVVIVKFNKLDLSLVSLNNFGGINDDYFYSVIESDGYYIAVGYSGSDLSGLNGGSAGSGGLDFVIAKFGD